MSNFAVFRLRNQPFFSFKDLHARILLLCFSLFLITGNFFRLLSLPPFPSHFSVVEVCLYALAFPLYFSSLKKSQALLVGILFSTIYGTGIHGLNIPSVLYAAKLIAMIATGVAVGDLCFKKFGREIENCFSFFIKIFSAILLLGGVIFFCFPRANDFFVFLNSHGVHFFGDPHQKRFISPFFDPNFYSAIACIPMILSWLLRKKFVYFVLSFLFFLSIIITWSRSGIAACLMLIVVAKMIQLYTNAFHAKRFIGLVFLIPLLGGSLFFFSTEFHIFWDRFVHILDDGSAYARWITFQSGLKYFVQYPFFGMGYNYLSPFVLEELGILAIDSSLLLTLINFGLIPSLLFALAGVFWTLRRFPRFFRLKEEYPLLLQAFSWLYVYMLISVLFTSQFNNLLYYQFWLVPMITLFTYLDRVGGDV